MLLVELDFSWLLEDELPAFFLCALLEGIVEDLFFSVILELLVVVLLPELSSELSSSELEKSNLPPSDKLFL